MSDLRMITNIHGCIDKLCLDFINARIGMALDVLKNDEGYKVAESEYGALINQIYKEAGFELGSKCESVSVKFFDFHAIAAYRQGFADAQTLGKEIVTEETKGDVNKE